MKTKYRTYSWRDSEFPLPKNVTKDIIGAISDIPNRIYRLDNSMYQY